MQFPHPIKRNREMKKVLVITYYWPPAGGSGVQRWVKFIKYLPQFGWKSIVYTPENPDMTAVDYSLESDIPQGTVILRRPITEVYDLYRKFTGKKGGAAGEVNPINSQKKSLKQRLALFIRGNCFIPDPRVSWVRPSVRFLKKYLKEHPVDLIISTGPPHSMHLIARKVARSTGIPWIADFRDAWTKIFYYKHLPLTRWADRKYHALEKAVLDEATAVVSVSPMERDDFQQMTSQHIHLITNGYDGEDFDQVIEPDGYFNLTNTGLFSSDGNPLTLWKILSELCASDPVFHEKMRIRLVGKIDREVLDAIRAAGLEDHLVNLGYKDHTTAVREQMNASILLLLLRREPEYGAALPGKLFEYLASSRPILGIGQPDGAMATIVGQTRSGEVHDWEDEQGIREMVLRIWKQYLSGGIPPVGEGKEQFSRKAITARMAALMDEVIEKHSKTEYVKQ